MFVVAMGLASGVSAAPDESRVSLGFSVGRAQPRSGAGLDGGSVFVGSAGYNLTQSTALGVEFGTASFDPSPRGYEPPLRAVFVAGHIAAGPRYGRWHPYVIGGLGLYRFALNAGPVSHGESKGADYKLGVNGGGGIGIRVARRIGIDVTARYHRVGDIMAIVPFGGSFLTTAVGITWSR